MLAGRAARGRRRIGQPRGPGRPAAVLAVLQALTRAGEVLPVALAHRRRRIGLLHAGDDLVEEAGLEVLGVGQGGAGVRVLGLEVCDHLRVVALP